MKKWRRKIRTPFCYVMIYIILCCPTLAHCLLYYQRQFSTYNLGKRNVIFYLWNDTIGKHCSTDIALCLLKYIQEHWLNKKEGERKFIV